MICVDCLQSLINFTNSLCIEKTRIKQFKPNGGNFICLQMLVKGHEREFCRKPFSKAKYILEQCYHFCAPDFLTVVSLDGITLLGFPEPQKNNVAPAIRSTYVDYIHNLKSYKTPQTYPLAKAILTAIPVETVMCRQDSHDGRSQ